VEEELNQYVYNLKNIVIGPREEDDEIIWLKKKSSRRYTTNLGYATRLDED